MKKLWDFRKVLSYQELEGQGRGIIMRVTHPLLLGPFYYVFSYVTPNISTPSVFETFFWGTNLLELCHFLSAHHYNHYAIPLFFSIFFKNCLNLKSQTKPETTQTHLSLIFGYLNPKIPYYREYPDQVPPFFKYLMPSLIGGTHPFVGDGFCNAETNNAVCNFDGGDCCGTCVNKKHCSNPSR